MKSTPWPLHPADIKTANITIPFPLKRFLLGVLVGDPDSKQQTERINTLIQSFSQDIIYAVHIMWSIQITETSFFPML
jgi:hypothetical protein